MTSTDLISEATAVHAATLAGFKHAQDAATSADGAREQAQAAFDRTGTDAALDALELATTSARRAQQHLGRATRLHGESEAQLARRRRDGIREEAAVLDEHLSPTRIRERSLPLVEAEVRALVALHEARIARGDLAREFRDEVRRRHALGRDIDEPYTLNATAHDIHAVGEHLIKEVIDQMGLRLRDLEPSALDLLRSRPKRGRRGPEA